MRTLTRSIQNSLRALAVTTALATTLNLGPGLFAATPPTAPVFAQETSDLKADPAAHFGKLPNGMRYVIMHNAEPKNRASLRLLVATGSFQETEEQRGLAHFLEHMAFNGSTHFKPGTLVEFFQRMGMSFGGDTNASTSFDRTIYQLELPDTKPETLAESFTLFADYAGGLLIEQQSIEKERGIILSEKRARDSVEFRQMLANLSTYFSQTLIPNRIPIGLPAVIEGANRDRFVDYYNTWYRPERMAVIAVGDFDVASVEKQITDILSPVAARAPARPDPDLGALEKFKDAQVTYHYEAEATSTDVSIEIFTPITPEPDNSAKRLKDLPQDIATSMLNRRLSILAKQENSTFTRGQSNISEGFNLFRNSSLELSCKPDQWAAALATAVQELRRATEYGFTDAELREATANMLNALEQAVKTAPTRRSDHLARSITSALMTKEVFTTPADDLALLKPALAALTPEVCAKALRNAFPADGRFVTVTGNAKIADDTAASGKAIFEAYKSALELPVAPPAKVEDATFAYTDFGTAGTVKKKSHVEDLNLDLITYNNDVRLNLKKTDFEAGKIYINVRIGTGELTTPTDKPGLATLANHLVIPGGLGKHSADDLRRILAGRSVGTGFRVANDALVFTAVTTREDLQLQLQLITAYITDAGYRPEAFRQAQKQIEQTYIRLAHTPQGPLQLDVPRMISGGDKRFGYPKKAELTARTVDEVRAWLTPQFKNGALEIAIIGDLDIDATVASVASTLGTLPARAPKPALEAERRITIPAPVSDTYVVVTEIPKGILALYWPTTDARDVRITRRLTMLASVFNDRLRVQVREKLGDSYSPNAGSDASETYRDFGVIYAMVFIDPAKAAFLDETICAIADDLHENGVTEDELTRAKQPILTGLRESVRTNAYWLNAVLAAAQEYPQRLDWSRSRQQDFETISKADLDELAKKYMAAFRAFRATVVPAAVPSPATVPDKK